MDATATPHAELLEPGAPLGTLIADFDEQTLTALLVARFRSFIALGYREGDALMAAVGRTCSAHDPATALVA